MQFPDPRLMLTNQRLVDLLLAGRDSSQRLTISLDTDLASICHDLKGAVAEVQDLLINHRVEIVEYAINLGIEVIHIQIPLTRFLRFRQRRLDLILPFFFRVRGLLLGESARVRF